MMAVYQIDANRGDDGNDGVNAPFRSLTKLATLVPADGDSVLLAADSLFELTTHIIIASGWAGTKKAPITIGRYFPLGVNSGMPRIQIRREIPATAWTYDAANNGWYVTWFGADVGWGSYLTLGGAWATRQEAPLPLEKVSGAWKEAPTGRVYVYAPASTNPSDYYGPIYFSPASRGALSFSNKANYVVFEDLECVDGGPLVFLYSNSGARTYKFRRINCQRTGLALFLSVETAGSARLEVEESSFSGGSTAYINTYSNGAAGFGGLKVSRNKFRGGNEGYPQGNVYMQARSPGAKSEVVDNDFEGAKFGTWSHQNDGCAVYAEVGCDNVIVSGNAVRNTHTAFQDNSGRTTTWESNLTVDCRQAMQCTDASGIGLTNHKFNWNTILGAGAPIAAQGPKSAPGVGWWCWQDLPIDIKNNVFVLHRDAEPAAAIEVGVKSPGVIEGNIHYGGFTALAETYQGGPSPIPETSGRALMPNLNSIGNFVAR